jgi:hypothetical protein
MNSKMTLPPNLTGPDTPAAENSANRPAEQVDVWGEARAAYPIYAALAKQFGLSELAYAAGELPPAKPTREVFEQDLQWLEEMDLRLKAFQIRQLPPSTLNGNEEALRAFIHRQLRKQEKTETDRDKIDFLVVQYFALCAPESMYHEEITLEDVSRVLRPVVVNEDYDPIDWCLPLEQMLDLVKECRSLRDLLERGVLEQGRMLKESSGPLFYDPAALITFARFNFLVRRAFIRLLHSDQGAVVKAIDELDRAGVRSVDCRRAGFTAAESLATLRLFAQNWRPLYHKDYSENAVTRSFDQLLALRTDLEDALAKLSGSAAETSTPVEDKAGAEGAPVAESNAAGTSSGEASSDPASTEASPETKSADPAAPSAHADISGKPLELMNPNEPVPAPDSAASAEGKDSQAGATQAAGSAIPAESEWFLKAISEQLSANQPSSSRTMSTIVLKNTKVLLSSWEVDAFVNDAGQESHDLRRAVVARAMIAVAMDSRKQTGESASLKKALDSARSEVAYFQRRVEEAKQSKNIEAAVNLGISTKRLLSFIEESEKIEP